tara:strand:+ start:718 stop:1347 length:630 start_codon:yes stop_codon:yes gene_type:complete
MAFVLTYETLTTTIKDYVERQDARFIDTIPVFLVLGQQRVCKDLKILNIKNVVTDSLTTNVQLVAKPGDWITSNYFNILQPNGEKLILKFRSNEYCDTYWPNPTDVGVPKYFADYTFNTTKIVPTPDQDYPYEFGYYALPPLLDETNGTNILTSTIPQVLIYACLLETASYLKDDERLPVWTDYYSKAKDAVNAEDLSRIYVGFTSNNH